MPSPWTTVAAANCTLMTRRLTVRALFLLEAVVPGSRPMYCDRNERLSLARRLPRPVHMRVHSPAYARGEPSRMLAGLPGEASVVNDQ